MNRPQGSRITAAPPYPPCAFAPRGRRVGRALVGARQPATGADAPRCRRPLPPRFRGRSRHLGGLGPYRRNTLCLCRSRRSAHGPQPQAARAFALHLPGPSNAPTCGGEVARRPAVAVPCARVRKLPRRPSARLASPLAQPGTPPLRARVPLRFADSPPPVGRVAAPASQRTPAPNRHECMGHACASAYGLRF